MFYVFLALGCLKIRVFTCSQPLVAPWGCPGARPGHPFDVLGLAWSPVWRSGAFLGRPGVPLGLPRGCFGVLACASFWYLGLLWGLLGRPGTFLTPPGLSRSTSRALRTQGEGYDFTTLNPKSVGIRVDGVGRHGVTPAPHTPYTFSAGCVWCLA